MSMVIDEAKLSKSLTDDIETKLHAYNFHGVKLDTVILVTFSLISILLAVKIFKDVKK